MRLYLLIFMYLTSTTFVVSQNINRVEVSGVIIVKSEDLEGVSVFNTSSNKGTITNEKGKFKIEVALNDELEISALQFRPSKLKITQEIINSKALKVHLIEQVNALDEVVLLPHDLTGDLLTDSEDIKMIKPVNFSFGSFNDFEMPDDYKSAVENTAITQSPKYLMDVGKIINLIMPNFFKGKKKKEKKQNKRTSVDKYIPKLSHALEESYFVEHHNIPKNKVKEFILFVEGENFDASLLTPERKMELIEFLNQKSKLFLKQK